MRLFKILESQNLYALSNYHVGTNPSQYDSSLVAALSAAIVVAQGINNNIDATQMDVDAAVTNLQAVIITIVAYTPTPSPLSLIHI